MSESSISNGRCVSKAASKQKRRDEIIESALKLFARCGYYQTTIPEIAKTVGMSVGNFYNYFPSKENLAKELILHISQYLGSELRKINEMTVSTEAKILKIVQMYFQMAEMYPEMIDFFLRIYLSNREVFDKECQGMICVSSFMTEMMIFFDEGVESGSLRNQDFFSAFGLFMGYLGGMVFLNGESVLPEKLTWYEQSIATNIYNALKRYDG